MAKDSKRTALQKAAAAVVEAIERDEAHDGGLLGRDTLKLVGLLRLELQRQAQ
jgi:hypothetical protein